MNTRDIFMCLPSWHRHRKVMEFYCQISVGTLLLIQLRDNYLPPSFPERLLPVKGVGEDVSEGEGNNVDVGEGDTAEPRGRRNGGYGQDRDRGLLLGLPQ